MQKRMKRPGNHEEQSVPENIMRGREARNDENYIARNAQTCQKCSQHRRNSRSGPKKRIDSRGANPSVPATAKDEKVYGFTALFRALEAGIRFPEKPEQRLHHMLSPERFPLPVMPQGAACEIAHFLEFAFRRPDKVSGAIFRQIVLAYLIPGGFRGFTGSGVLVKIILHRGFANLFLQSGNVRLVEWGQLCLS